MYLSMLLQEGMERFKLRSFLRENPSKENINFIFPSADDITVDPDMFMAAVITRGDDFDQSTLEFLQQFLRDLHAGKIGELISSDFREIIKKF